MQQHIYIANSYSRKCLCDSPFYNQINSAKDVFNINYDTKKLIPKTEEILTIKYNLKIVNNNPLRLKRYY